MGTTQAYNLEVIESNKRESAREYFFELESKLMSEETGSKPIGEVEQLLYSDIMELGRRMIQEHIDARGDGKVAESIIRKDDKKLSHKRLLKRHLETIFGEVEIERVGYSHRGESSVFPKDEQMTLPAKLYSYPVQQKVCREALRSSYDEIDETLSEYTGAHVAKRQSLEIVGNGAEDFEAFYLQRSWKEGEVEGEILVYSGDGKGIPMRKEGLREQTQKRATSQKLSNRLSKGEKKNRKREALVASVYNVAPHVRTADDIMEEFFGEKKPSTTPPRPKNKRVWASLAKEKEEVFEEMVHEGRQRTTGVETAVFLCDGAPILQDLAKKHLSPQWHGTSVPFLIILDLIHVLGYLWSAAFAFYLEGDPRVEAFVGKYLRMIVEGKASFVAGAIRRLATLRKLEGLKRKAVDKAADYFLQRNNFYYLHCQRSFSPLDIRFAVKSLLTHYQIVILQ